ncbi:MAG: Trk system potassium transporter TrkA [Lachnospiraceae bacterium]|nr:Trk system potassium transporter TrkA [Lachnospiraceae bacterium]MBP5249622.1 Trk system potassium transporter TrkA [Lachnospiraceae bacterium]
MDVIIVGCGRVGYILADHLSKENHNITLVDTDETKLQPALANLDVQAVIGNGTTSSCLMEAGIKNTGLLIAVTDMDEINMISCIMAKKANPKCQTIARIRKPEYLPERNYFKQAFGMSMIINPELAASNEINQLINVPAALELDSFARGRLDLLRIVITETSVLAGMRVIDVSKKFDRKVLICIVVHNGEIIIPNGMSMLSAGDSISVIIPKAMIPTFYNTVCDSASLRVIKNVMICGGGVTAHYLAETLCDNGVNVKIIEDDRERCEQLSAELPKCDIINADATNHDVLLENGLEDMDAFVALTTVDSENCFLSIYASKAAPRCKLITRVHRLEQDEIITTLPIGSIITPRRITAEAILQFVRAMQNSKGSNVEALYELMDNKVEALEFSIRENSKVLNTPLQTLKLKPNLLVCAIVRGRRIITPSGKDTLQLGDTVIVVTTNLGLKDIKDILAD